MLTDVQKQKLSEHIAARVKTRLSEMDGSYASQQEKNLRKAAAQAELRLKQAEEARLRTVARGV